MVQGQDETEGNGKNCQVEYDPELRNSSYQEIEVNRLSLGNEEVGGVVSEGEALRWLMGGWI